MRERVAFLDYTKIFSIICVIAGHTACQIIDGRTYAGDTANNFAAGTLTWSIAVIFDAFFMCSVPLFVMISGAILLHKELSHIDLFKKYIPRFLISYLTWGVLYTFLFGDKSIYQLLRGSIYSMGRLSFIGTITALYIISPLLKKILTDKKSARYLIVVCFVGGSVCPQCADILASSHVDLLVNCGKAITFLLARFNVWSFISMICYFVLGYYIWEYKTTVRLVYLVPSILALGGVTGIVTSLVSNARQEKWWCLMHYNTVNVMIYSTLLFILFMNFFDKYQSRQIKKMVIRVSNATYGIYLIHTYILDYWLQVYFELDATCLNPFISIPIITVVVYLISLGISLILNRIPVVRKWVV